MIKTNNKAKNKGITLIALIITIIILLILAGVAITTLTGDEGLFSRAKEAKEESRAASVEEAVELWRMNEQTAKYENNGTVQTREQLVNDLVEQKLLTEDEKDTILGNNLKGIQATYQITIGKRTIRFEETTTAWVEENGVITKGDKHYTIGDTIEYNPLEGAQTTSITSEQKDNGYGDQTFNISSYTGGWKVLGTENGKLKVISSDVIRPDTGGINGTNAQGTDSTKQYFTLKGQTGYDNGITELDKICKLFGQGKNVVKARSLRIEDINKITGFNPECIGIKNPTEEQIKTGESFVNRYDSLVAYGREVSYYWDTDNSKGPYYEYIDKEETTVGNNLGNVHAKGFLTYENGKWNTLPKPTEAISSKEFIKNITCDSYTYYPETLTHFENENATVGIAHNSPEYETLFEGDAYILASRSIATGSVSSNGCAVCYDFRCVCLSTISNQKQVATKATVTSVGSALSTSWGIRAVLLLDI